MSYMKTICWMAGLSAVACAFLFRPSVLGAQGATGEYPNLSPAEARELLGKRSGDPDFVLLDVRTQKEFDAERIAGAVIVDYNSPSFRDENSDARSEQIVPRLLPHGKSNERSRQGDAGIGVPERIRVSGRDHEMERGGIPNHALARHDASPET